MFEVFFKIGFFITVFPILVIIEGFKKLKVFLAKRGLVLDWPWIWLILLVIFLLILLFYKYGY